MNKQEKLDLANWVITQARKSGADDAAVDLSQQRDVDIEYREQKLDRITESTSNSLSLTIYAQNKYSSHSTSDIRKENLPKFISEAVAMTKYLTEDEFRTLPDPKYYKGMKDIDLNIRDNKYEDVTADDRLAMIKVIEDAARQTSDQIISCTAYCGDSYYEAVKVHSNGFEGNRESTSFYAGAEATVRDGDKGRPQDWNFVTTRFRKSIPDLNELGSGAVKRALQKVGQTKMESGVYDMIVENRAASRLLYSLMYPLSGRALQQKRSFLEGMQGKQIASAKLTIIDDPFIPAGLGSRLYDGDGIATKRRTIIDKGVLQTYYIDNYYGKKLGVEPTTGGSSNLVFFYGDKSLDELIKQAKKGILVNGFIGGNSNSTTGDYSFGIVGMYIEDGKLVKPINEMNISGNFKDLLMQLAEVGNDPYEYSSMRRPSLYFTDMQFSGI